MIVTYSNTLMPFELSGQPSPCTSGLVGDNQNFLLGDGSLNKYILVHGGIDFLDHPPNQNIYYVNVDGLGRHSKTIQNLILVHQLIWIRSVSGFTGP